MKIEQFSEALGNVNDKYINEAIDSKHSTRDPKRMNRSLKVWRAIAIAACAILVVSGGLLAAAAGLGGAFNKGAADYRDTSMAPAGAGEYNGAYVSDDEAHYDDYAKDAAMAPEDFVRDVLSCRMQAECVVAGSDVSFGAGGADH